MIYRLKNIVRVVFIDWHFVSGQKLLNFEWNVSECVWAIVCTRAIRMCVSMDIYEEFKLKWKHQLN